MRAFQKLLRNQTKDFQLIHKAVKLSKYFLTAKPRLDCLFPPAKINVVFLQLQTKSVAQCVEYYYNMKKLKKFKQRCKGIENAVGARKNSVGFI